ncbi:hypothetical protein GCM10022225_51190 [Plantactinospora mayteni]|uniref:Uncharacterized protein n=1 Tax=Plantactinospora mayteni TaxID=566021 RepID=A0ABQ4F477_9ACTN|nr:hypothetical protein [Plantactinospora mayteni]GIH01702.1 hypothetical protein Pma05_82740 [Plantactinospora mayteni]
MAADADAPLAWRPVGAVVANLAMFAGAQALVQLEASVEERGLRAVFAVAGAAGAGLVALADDGVELSMFDSVRLGAELVRVMPAASDLAGSESARIGRALGGGANQRPSGRLPLTALAEYAPAAEPAGAAGKATGGVGTRSLRRRGAAF